MLYKANYGNEEREKVAEYAEGKEWKSDMFLWQGDKMTIGIIKTPAEEIALFRMVDIRSV